MTTPVGAPATDPDASSERPPTRRPITRVAIVAVALAAAIMVAVYATRPTADPREEGGVATLDQAFPGLRGEAVAGPPVDTASTDRMVLVVNVWATWCAPCRREQPALQKVHAAYAGRGVEFLGINYRDDRAAAKRWIDDFEVAYPSLYDPDGRTAALLGFPFLPDTYLVDASGTMRFAVYGETSGEELTGLIDQLLADPAGAAAT